MGERESHSDVGGEGPSTRVEGQSEASSEKEEGECGVGGAHSPDYLNPALWPARMGDTDKVNIVCAMSKRIPFSEMAKTLASDAEGREFPHYLTYSTSLNGWERIDRDWIVYSRTKEALFSLPFSLMRCRKGQQVHLTL